MSRGLYIALDGPDGCGKTTQCKILLDRLRSHGEKAELFSQIGGGRLGKCVRDIVLHGDMDLSYRTQLLLFAAAQSHLLDKHIRPLISAGVHVITDRSWYSSLVYQCCAPMAVNDPTAVSTEDVVAAYYVTHPVGAVLFPDVSLILTAPFSTLVSRRKPTPDNIERRPTEYHEAVLGGFLDLPHKIGPTHGVDTAGTIDAAAREVWSLSWQAVLEREIEELREGRHVVS